MKHRRSDGARGSHGPQGRNGECALAVSHIRSKRSEGALTADVPVTCGHEKPWAEYHTQTIPDTSAREMQ